MFQQPTSGDALAAWSQWTLNCWAVVIHNLSSLAHTEAGRIFVAALELIHVASELLVVWVNLPVVYAV